MMANHPRHSHSPFGVDRFGQLAESVARFLGTPKFIIIQTLIVIIWMVTNGLILVGGGWDPYPWILLNLLFSTQAAYASPFILLAQARQADRDKAMEDSASAHRQEVADAHERQLAQSGQILQENTDLTLEVRQLVKENTELTEQIRQLVKDR